MVFGGFQRLIHEKPKKQRERAMGRMAVGRKDAHSQILGDASERCGVLCKTHHGEQLS